MHTLHRDPLRVAQRRRRSLQTAKTSAQHRQLLLSEPGAHLPAEPQITILVVTNEQCPQPRACPTGVRPPDHDELLLVAALELQPVLGPSMRVGRRSSLRDEALPPLLARGTERRLPVLVEMLREADRIVEGEGLAEERLARAQRQGGEVVAIEPDQIEHVVVHRHRGDLNGARSRVLHPCLQTGERRHIAVERDDLAVG